MKRRYLPFVALALTGCTQAQINAWLTWYETDPDAAVEFAQRDEIQALLQRPVVNHSPGDCDSYVPLFERYGLPVATFKRIAWRESGCNHRSFVSDSDDLGGGLLGINLRAGARMWNDWCGLTIENVTHAETNVHCAAEAYQRMGMKPWG
jgi:hypothetical protein